MDDILGSVRTFAAEAHRGQRRKYTPEDYIAHPVRVMETCKKYSTEVPILAAALLHDVLEDTDVDPEKLHRFLLELMNRDDAAKTLQLVTELTDIYTKAAWPRMNRRNRKAREAGRLVKASDQAQTIKYADIIDNAKEIAAHDADFGLVYLRECETLLKQMEKGNSELRQQAINVVAEEINILKKINDPPGQPVRE